MFCVLVARCLVFSICSCTVILRILHLFRDNGMMSLQIWKSPRISSELQLNTLSIIFVLFLVHSVCVAIVSPVATILWILSSKPPKKGQKAQPNGAEPAAAAPKSTNTKKSPQNLSSTPTQPKKHGNPSPIDNSAPKTVVKLRRTQKQESPKEQKKSTSLFKNILKKRGSKSKKRSESSYREETHIASSGRSVAPSAAGGASVPPNPPPVLSNPSTWRVDEPEADYSSGSASSSACPSPPPSPFAAQVPKNGGLPPLPSKAPPSNPQNVKRTLRANAVRNTFRFVSVPCF